MRTRILLVLAVVSLLAVPASADAFKWRMRYGQAKHATREYAQGLCEELRECTGYGVGQCYRRSLSKFSCTMATFFPPANYEEPDIECVQVLHWGVARGGRIVLKARSRPHCY